LGTTSTIKSDGGVVYIGIDDSGTAIGVDTCDSVELKIKDRLKNNIQPSTLGLFDVFKEEIEGKEVIRITLASGPEKPYHIKKYGMSEKGCYIRVGSASEPMPVRMIEDLFARRIRNSIGKIQSPKQDLTFEQLKIYYDEAGFTIRKNFVATLELLTDEGKYNYAAYLLADTNSNSVKVAKYAGVDRVDLVESNEYGYCCLVKAAHAVLDKLDLENKTMTEITAKVRVDNRPFNSLALREAVINAIIHNDYSHEVPPKFELFADRLEITSAGSIPQGLSQEEFFEGYSVPRNKEMMRIFKDVHMVEYLGSGLPRILNAYSKDVYIFSENFIRIIFPAVMQKKATGKATGKTTGKTTGNEIVRLCAENPKITIPELAEVLDLTEDGINYQLRKLRESNVLVREGGRKEGYWKVL
jgi:ATP-dependent DNA helicase RecG